MSKVDIERETRRHALLQASATILAGSPDLVPDAIRGDIDFEFSDAVNESVSRAELLLAEIERREK